MRVITNLRRSYLCLNKADGSGLHLPPRGSVTLDDSEVSGEITRASHRGDVSISAASPQPTTKNETPVEVAVYPPRRKRS